MFLGHDGMIRISPGFCLLMIWFAAANGWKLLSVILGAAVVHEAGHWLMLRLLGARILGLQIGILGAVMETDGRRLSYGRELLCVLAGPASNLLGAFILTAVHMEVMAGAHFVLGICNLLPVRPLDGGRALYLMIAWWFGPTVGERVARWIGMIVALVLALMVAYVIWYTRGSLWLLPAMAGLFTAAGRECLVKG